ncbi:hypothetical protein ACWJJH_00145 [Endozoicomonadaceae bacterium StTr2]
MRTLNQTQLKEVAGGFNWSKFGNDAAEGFSTVSENAYDAYENFSAGKYGAGAADVLKGLGHLASAAANLVSDAMDKGDNQTRA